MTRADEEVVRRFADAMVSRDVGAIAESLADDVVFHIPGRNSLSGQYRGKREVLTRLFQAWEEAFAASRSTCMTSSAPATTWSS